jgi:hypothetical protein
MSKAQRDQTGDETGFRNPPLWFHVSEAMLAPREAKKRAVIRIIDKIKAAPKIGVAATVGVRAQPKKSGSDPNLA